MVSRNLAKPIFPLAPDTYDRRYMDTLVQAFSVYLEQYQNPGEGRSTTNVFTNTPTSPTGLESGTVWLDSTLLRIGGTVGSITFSSIDVTGTFSLAGVAVTASAAELNYNDITTLGTLQASKVVTASAAKAINFDSGALTNVNIDSGSVDGAPIGATTPSTGAFTSATVTGNFTVDTSTLFVDSTNNRVGVNTLSPQRALHALVSDSSSSAVTNAFRIDHQATTTPAIGIGVGIEFAAETTANNTEVGVVLEAVTQIVTAGSEAFDFVVKTMSDGAAAAERFRVSSAGFTTVTAIDAAANTVLDALRLSRQTSVSPGAGIGVGIEFAVETTASNTEIGGVLEVVTTDIAAGSEDFDLVFRLMAAGAAAAERLRITSTGVVYRIQPAQSSEAATATLTIAELLTGIIQYTGAAANLTLPTGTSIEGGVSSGFPTNMSFDFSVINTGSDVATILTNTGLTLVGGMTVAAGVSGAFRVRKTALNTYTVYRMA